MNNNPFNMNWNNMNNMNMNTMNMNNMNMNAMNMNTMNMNNMNQVMNNMNQMLGCNYNMNQFDQFNQMINSNPMLLMLYNQMLNQPRMQNNFMNNNQTMMIQGGVQNNNPFFQMNNNPPQNTNGYQINLKFINSEGKTVLIQTDPNEYMSSVINKYINKSNDLNNNYYLFNGKRIVQSLTVSELGITDGIEIHVANAGNILGAK